MLRSGDTRQHHLHHHYHCHYYRCSAFCNFWRSRGLSELSPSSAEQADPSKASSHNYTHTHSLVAPLDEPQPHCLVHALKLTDCPLHPAEHTHCALQERTHIARCLYDPSEGTHITHSPWHLTTQTDTTPSAERIHIPSISSLQTSGQNDVDLYATPQEHLKKPKRCKTHSKLYTPFPAPNAPPYILCQHCFQLLSLPCSPSLYLLTVAPVLKLRCALCTKVSFFSTRRMPSSSEAIRHGHIYALKAAQGIAGGEFQFKVEQTCTDADMPTFDVSCKEGDYLRRLEQKSMDAHGPTTDVSTNGLKREQRIVDTHLPITNTLAHRVPLHLQENEIINTDALIGDITTERCDQGNCWPPHSPPKLNPEFSGFSSVQDWVNSIEQESFQHCPTPLNGAGFGSDLQLQEPIDWRIEKQNRGDTFTLPLPGSPLHEHFGYKSPAELINKILSSDDENKLPSDTNSSASTSATSANTFKPPGFEKADGSACKSGHRSFFVKQGSKNSTKSIADAEQNEHGSLANFLKRSFKGFGERRSSPVPSTGSRVTVNGHTLSRQALKRAEEQAGKLRPGTYWYDSKAGFWGITGGPCLGVLPPFIEELHYPMTGDCSNGDTRVFVNGRELHDKDLEVLAFRGLSRKPGMAYAVGFDGTVIEETSGQELKHLGKLAPTVERRGKGFGMYMAKQ